MSDLKVHIAQKEIYTYPDVTVVCGQPVLTQGRTDTITNPKVIIEVLSKATAAYDRGEKFQACWTLKSLEEYILIDQYQHRVEAFRRVGGNL